MALRLVVRLKASVLRVANDVERDVNNMCDKEDISHVDYKTTLDVNGSLKQDIIMIEFQKYQIEQPCRL